MAQTRSQPDLRDPGWFTQNRLEPRVRNMQLEYITASVGRLKLASTLPAFPAGTPSLPPWPASLVPAALPGPTQTGQTRESD